MRPSRPSVTLSDTAAVTAETAAPRMPPPMMRSSAASGPLLQVSSCTATWAALLIAPVIDSRATALPTLPRRFSAVPRRTMGFTSRLEPSSPTMAPPMPAVAASMPIIARSVAASSQP